MDESICTYCQKPAVRKPHVWKVRRGNRFVSVSSDYWECQSNCMGPDGEQPFAWLGPILMREVDVNAEIAWLEVWKEPIPPSEGRSNGKPR